MQISISRQLGLQPATVGNFFMNARRRLHDKWAEMQHLNDNDADGSVDGSLMNDDESDFVNDLVAEQQQQLDSNDLQACLGHESVQAMLMENDVDNCDDMDANLDHCRSEHHHNHLGDGSLLSHLDNVSKENNLRLQLSVPHHLQQQQLQLQQHHQQQQQQHQQQLQYQIEHQHVYSLTSL